MRLTFLGADHEVTGSCHMLETCKKVILVDCGMEQGPDIYENQEIPVNPADIDYVLLTHAHIDHSGLLPLLYKRGFKGTIFSTYATSDLCEVMLRDSAHIQEFEAEWRNRKAKRAGKPEYVPLYTIADADGASKLFCGCPYGERIHLADGIDIRFTDVGHLLGSACIEVWLQEDGVEKKLVFSGDIGNLHQPILKDPAHVETADYVLIESTYGDRSHGPKPDYVKELTRIIQETFDRGGNVVIPSFAVGRTQEMLYFLREIKAKKLIHGHDGFKVYIDSPLAVQATTIFNKNMYDCFDDEPKVILSASGMCEAGRIRHHLKHNLWRPESTVLFVGYQAVGTLGRSLVEGANEVKLFGEPVEVKAHIEVLAGISGHADKEGLISWIQGFRTKPQRVFVVHGEDQVCDTFAACLHEEYGFTTTAPYTGEIWDLATNSRIAEGNQERIVKEQRKNAKAGMTVYDRLVETGKRLMRLIDQCKGWTNKDIAKLADQIQALCDKWEK